MTLPGSRSRGTVLAVRLDNDGDVLLTGPALRALAAGAEQLVVLAASSGAQAAALLPGVDEVLVWDAPWTGFTPPGPDPALLERGVELARRAGADEAVVFTSPHQSSLPAAVLLRLAGVPRVSAISDDYPGSLLDVRHRVPADLHEVQRALSLAAAAGFTPPPGDDDRLRVDLPPGLALTEGSSVSSVPRHAEGASTEVTLDHEGGGARAGGRGPYVVVHPGASVPARAPSPEWSRCAVAALRADGREVVVTGSPAETALTRSVAVDGALDLGGRTTYAELAAVLRDADALVVGNTGPGHLAAAVGTPVVSLFAPVVPVERWRPWGVPLVVLGDRDAPCAGSRARTCPVPGHPCLDGVQVAEVVAAVDTLAPARVPVEVRS